MVKMRMECCDKVIRTPYCPECGTKADTSLSLVQYLERELVSAKTSVKRITKRLNPNLEFHRATNRARNNTRLVTAEAKVKRLEGWLFWIKSKMET